jgi:ubiquitin C-terminal hydrolase
MHVPLDVRSVGLVNAGNTCYVNVVLQALMHTAPLVLYIRAHNRQPNCERICTYEILF